MRMETSFPHVGDSEVLWGWRGGEEVTTDSSHWPWWGGFLTGIGSLTLRA
jgi:hypothetical protein